jgi:hypothetical protein
MVECIATFLNICYIVRREDINQQSLAELDYNISRFHQLREVFRDTGVRPEGFSLPRQHSLSHYHHHVMEFGAPGGVCSSITESRHITAVKKPWRRSNRHNALSQMLLTNQRLDKLAAARVDYIFRGMIPPDYAAPFEPPKRTRRSAIDAAPVDEIVEGSVMLARSKGKS